MCNVTDALVDASAATKGTSVGGGAWAAAQSGQIKQSV